MYYLQSRYYGPEVGRFINADNAAYLGANGSLTSYNLFAYCGNNPVNRTDYAGADWETDFQIGSLVVVITILTFVAFFTGGTGALAFSGISAVAVSSDTAVLSAMSLAAGGALLFEASKGGNLSTQLGQKGEQQAGINQNEKKSFDVNGRTRIPDSVDSKVLKEVKNVKYIYRSLQLRDYEEIAQSLEIGLELVVRTDTKVAKTLLNSGWKIVYLIVN